VHFDELNFFRIGNRRINPLAIDELALFGENRHAFGTQEAIDKSLACVRVRRLVAKR
jgi:hypothetical protein